MRLVDEAVQDAVVEGGGNQALLSITCLVPHLSSHNNLMMCQVIIHLPSSALSSGHQGPPRVFHHRAGQPCQRGPHGQDPGLQVSGSPSPHPSDSSNHISHASTSSLPSDPSNHISHASTSSLPSDPSSLVHMCRIPPSPTDPSRKTIAKRRIFEVTVHSDGSDILTSMSVSLGTNTSKFSAAIDRASRIYVEGAVGRGYRGLKGG